MLTNEKTGLTVAAVDAQIAKLNEDVAELRKRLTSNYRRDRTKLLRLRDVLVAEADERTMVERLAEPVEGGDE